MLGVALPFGFATPTFIIEPKLFKQPKGLVVCEEQAASP